MPAKKKPYTKIQCTVCKEINYFTHKSKMSKMKEGEGKLEFKKFCKHCRKRTLLKEAKK